MPQLTPDTPIDQIYGVGEIYAKRLKKLNLFTVKDLLYHKPARYEDWSLISPINQIQAGEKITIQGQITNFQTVITRNHKHIQIATITDQTASLKIVWYNQKYLLNVIKPGQWYNLAGKADLYNHELSLVSPEFEQIRIPPPTPPLKRGGWQGIHTGRLVPIYPETYGVSSKWLRAKIHYLLERVLPIPDWMENFSTKGDPPGRLYTLTPKPLNLTDALYQLHFPNTIEKAEQAIHRLAHDELLLLHLETQRRRANWKINKVAFPLRLPPLGKGG